jgi:hypothetical protein
VHVRDYWDWSQFEAVESCVYVYIHVSPDLHAPILHRQITSLILRMIRLICLEYLVLPEPLFFRSEVPGQESENGNRAKDDDSLPRRSSDELTRTTI